MSPSKKTCHAGDKHVVQPHKKALLRRLTRIEGQVRGIAAMICEDRYCVDILTQVSAVRAALDAVALQLIEDHTKGCVKKALNSGDEAVIDELLVVLKRFTR